MVLQDIQSNFRQIIINATEIKSMPAVAKQVVDLISKENTSAEQLQRVLMKDPAMCSKILKMSNSAFYGLQKEVKSIAMAIVVLGYKTLKTLVLTTASKSIYTNPGLVEEKLWEHSICAGIGARLFSQRFGFYNPDEAYIIGIFHDIGKTIINNALNNEYKKVFTKCIREKSDFCEAETRVFQIDHAETGGKIVRQWSLEEKMAYAIEFHHNANATTDLSVKKAINLVTICNYMCERIGAGHINPNENVNIPKFYPELSNINIPLEEIEKLIDEIGKTFEHEKKAFN